MNIVDCIKQDHSVLLKTAKAMSTTEDATAARGHYSALKPLLVVHSRAEEAVVYRELDKLGLKTLKEATQEGEVEHSLCDHLMTLLGRGKTDSPRWKARAKVLYELLEHHIEEEHEEMLPLLAKRFEAAALSAMGERFEARKQALMKG